MGVKAVTTIVVLYILVAVGVSLCFWDFFSKGEPSTSVNIRNLVLMWGTPLAIFLAVWRSSIVQKQAEIAQRGLLADRFQRSVEMLDHNLDSLCIGGIHALVDRAREHPAEYEGRVVRLLQVYYQPGSLSRVREAVEDAFLTILGEEKGQELLQQLEVDA